MKDYHNYMKVKDVVHPSLKSEKLDNLMEYCSENGVLFVDKEFPPEKRSLVGNPTPKDYDGQFDVIQWKRAKDLFGQGQYDLFRGIDPGDIKQGSLGNCYFLCSLASLAEYPDLIKRLFDYDSVNQYGIQSVWLNINGVWRRIILDEYFPSYNNGRQWDLAFSKTDQKELWVILLEKAYAKAYGSYWEIIGGDPVHALRDLTGAPYDRVEDFSDLNAAWAQIKEANTKQYMLTCFTKSTQITEEKSGEGLVAGHAYTILDVRNIIDSRGQPARILQIRNPWGKFEWSGDFGDNSSLWTQEQKRTLGVKASDDGIFWMKLEDFIKYFEGIGILEIIPGAISNGVQIDQTQNNMSMARISVSSPTHIMLSVDQIDSRIVDNPQYSYSYFRVTIGKLRGREGIDFIDSVLSPERNIFLENTLQAGDYIVLIEGYWSTNLVRKFNLGTYSDNEVGLELLKSNKTTYEHCEYLIWKEYGKKHYQDMNSKGQRRVSDGINQAVLNSYQYQNQKFANILYNYINESSDNAIHQTVKFAKMKGFNPVGRQYNQNGCELIVNPSDNDVMLFKMDPRSGQFSLAHQVTQEEVIPNRFSEDKTTYEILNSLGGYQPTPDNPKAEIESRAKRRRDQQALQRERERINKQRAQKMAENRKRVEEQRRRELEERKRQEQILRQKGYGNNQEGNFFDSIFGGLLGGLGGGSSWGFGSKKKKKQKQKRNHHNQGYNQQQQQYGQNQQQQYGQNQQQQYGQNQQQQYGQNQQYQQQGYNQQYRQQDHNQQQYGYNQQQRQQKQDCVIF